MFGNGVDAAGPHWRVPYTMTGSPQCGRRSHFGRGAVGTPARRRAAPVRIEIVGYDPERPYWDSADSH
jgi:hypothetical protein